MYVQTIWSIANYVWLSTNILMIFLQIKFKKLFQFYSGEMKSEDGYSSEEMNKKIVYKS